jgi:hypothetical protein
VRRYRFHRQALVEYQAATKWYADRSEVAAAFVTAVERAIRAIRGAPGAAARVSGTGEDIRRHLLRRFPFATVYLVDPEEIFIVAVSARPSPAWLLEAAPQSVTATLTRHLEREPAWRYVSLS